MTAKEQGLPAPKYLAKLSKDGEWAELCPADDWSAEMWAYGTEPVYTADQMRAYALAALASDSGGRGVVETKALEELLRRFEATIPTPSNRRGESTMRIEHFVDLVHEAKQELAALRAQPAGGGECANCRQGEVLAWARNSGDPNDDAFVISAKVKRLWMASNPKRVARYTRRLYSTHAPCWALPAVESALKILDKHGYTHTDLAAFRDWLKEKSA